MNWEDEGYLLSKRKFRENAIIISAFTNNYGKISGIVYGGTSRKIKNYLQVGNKIFIIHNSKSRNKLGYLKTEIIEAISPRYFNDKKKSYLLLSITDLLNSILPDEEVYKNIVSLPIYEQLKNNDILKIKKLIINFFNLKW